MEVRDTFSERTPGELAFGVVMGRAQDLEVGRFADGGFDPQDTTSLVVHLDGVAPEPVFDTNALGAVLEAGDDLAGEVALGLIVEMGKRNLRFLRQPEVVVFYDGQPAGKHRLDQIVEETIVVELKAVTDIVDAHLAIVRSYLKATGKKHGLILNFGRVPLEIKRVLG